MKKWLLSIDGFEMNTIFLEAVSQSESEALKEHAF